MTVYTEYKLNRWFNTQHKKVSVTMVIYTARLHNGQFVYTATSADLTTVVIKMTEQGYSKDQYVIVSFIVGKEYTTV
jgi:hypothetical protein